MTNHGAIGIDVLHLDISKNERFGDEFGSVTLLRLALATEHRQVVPCLHAVGESIDRILEDRALAAPVIVDMTL